MNIVVISAIWCPSCLILNKHLKKLKEDYEIVKYDYDFDEDIVKKYNVGKILPVIIALKDGEEVGRICGEKSYEEIIEFLRGIEVWKRF